jgi:hypothetical protein
METHVFEIPKSESIEKMLMKMSTGVAVFEETADTTPVQVPGEKNKKYRGYVPNGSSNNRMLEITNFMRQDEVLCSNMQFNIFAGYGNGLAMTKPDGTEITDKRILDFFKFNRPVKYLLEQQTDIKHYFFTVSVLILNREGSEIVRLIHKDASYCRFETCNPKTGVIEHVFFGDWETAGADNFEAIELLDTMNPLGDLMVRMGKLPNEEGVTKQVTQTRKFAIVNKIPTPGNSYYPFPAWWSIFNSGWYDIKQLIPEGKKAKLKNGLVLSYQVEINSDYWQLLFKEERITDPALQSARIKKEKEHIRDFLTGIANSGKVWFSGYYVHPVSGHEVSMVKITQVNNNKEGGDWIEDTEEASNMECYAQGVHPSLIGATPGKTKGSFSGSDKRELFTIKQAMEKPIRDILLEPYFVIKEYNQWDVKFEIPFVMLTTLDKKTDASVVQTTTEEK